MGDYCLHRGVGDLRCLGFEDYPHEVYWFLAYLAYSFIAYQFDEMKRQNRYLVEELEDTKDRLFAVERLLTNYPLIGAPSLHSQRDDLDCGYGCATIRTAEQQRSVHNHKRSETRRNGYQ